MVRNKLGNKLAKELALKLYVLSSFQFNDIYPLGYLCVYISTHTQKETNGQTEMRGKETASNDTPTKPFLSPSMFHLSDMGWVHQKMECSRTSVLLSVFWEVLLRQYCIISGMSKVLLYRLVVVKGPLFVVCIIEQWVWNSVILTLNSRSTFSVNILVGCFFFYYFRDDLTLVQTYLKFTLYKMFLNAWRFSYIGLLSAEITGVSPQQM